MEFDSCSRLEAKLIHNEFAWNERFITKNWMNQFLKWAKYRHHIYHNMPPHNRNSSNQKKIQWLAMKCKWLIYQKQFCDLSNYFNCVVYEIIFLAFVVCLMIGAHLIFTLNNHLIHLCRSICAFLGYAFLNISSLILLCLFSPFW